MIPYARKFTAAPSPQNLPRKPLRRAGKLTPTRARFARIQPKGVLCVSKTAPKDDKKSSFLNRFLNGIEVVGNRLPHPITLFALLALGICLLSALCAALGVSATGDLVNSATGQVEPQTVRAVSLLTRDGLVYMLTNAVGNFTGYAPLGTVLVAMLGVGVAEGSGFISALLKAAARVTPRALITPVVVLLGVLSNVASDAGYVVLIPVGALMFMAYGRHPMAGLAAAFSGVSGGFSANLIIGTLDPLLVGITNEAVVLVDPTYTVLPTSNLFFMMASVPLVTLLGTIVTDWVVEPRLGAYTPPDGGSDPDAARTLTPAERRGLAAGGGTLLLMAAGLILLAAPKSSFLRNPQNGSLVDGAPFMGGIIPIIALLFFVPAVVYGLSSGSFSGEKDVCAAMGKAMASLGSYIALAFVAAQFINYFNYTRLGTILALRGAELLGAAGIGGIPLMLLFILLSAFINLFMGSASAKWTILAPVFVPMFMLLGYTPELTQIAYRIGDSCTNLITPLMSYFAMIVVFAKRYDPKAGIGTLIATMLPYSLVFLVGWSLLLVVWMLLGFPVGPGAALTLPVA